MFTAEAQERKVSSDGYMTCKIEAVCEGFTGQVLCLKALIPVLAQALKLTGHPVPAM